MASKSDGLTSISRSSDNDEFVHPEPRPRRPLPALVVALIAGMAAGVIIPLILPGGLLAMAALFLIGSMMNLKQTGNGFLFASILFAGAAWMQIEVGLSDPRDLRNLLSRDRQFVVVEGTIVNNPVDDSLDHRGRHVWRFEFDVLSFGRTPSAQPATGRLHVRLAVSNDKIARFAYGERWRLSGVLSLDQRPILRAQGITGYLNGRGEDAQRVEGGGGNPFVAMCYRLRASAYDRLGWGMPADEPSVALTRALLLGYRQDIPRAVYDAFARTGTLHILALSGLHVGILILLAVVAMKAAGVTQPYWVLILLPFLAIYTTGTGAAASTVRASIMAIAFFSANLFRRKPDTPTALAAAALLILLFDPLQLFQYGFVLSFVVVSGLVILYPPLAQFVHRKTRPDSWTDPETQWWSGLHGGVRKVIDLFLISLAAWLASLPLIATAFHVISPIALVVNVALVPLAFIILFTACLSLLSGLVIPPAASVMNHANVLFGDLLLNLVNVTSQWPGGHYYVTAWPWMAALAWFMLLILAVAGNLKWKAVAVTGLLVMIAGSISARALNRNITLTAIPMADSLVLLVDGPGNHALLFDTGPSFQNRILIDQLRRRGISEIDQVWVTRATTDAYGGLSGLLESMKIKLAFVPAPPSGQRVYESQVQSWMSSSARTEINVWPVQRHFEFRDDLVWRMLYPPPGAPYRNARQSSLILHVSRGHRSLMFMGQTGIFLEQTAMNLPLDWNAEVLVAGSCRDVDSLTDEWLARVTPERVVLSTRAFDRSRQSPGALLARLHSGPDLEVIEVNDADPFHWQWPEQ